MEYMVPACIIAYLGGIVTGLIIAFSAIPDKPEWYVEEEEENWHE